MNYIVNFPKPFGVNQTAQKIVEADSAEHAKIYVQWLFNISPVTVDGMTSEPASITVCQDELKDLDLI